MYDVQSVEVKPLAFGLKFVQVHVVMNDGPGLTDEFESLMSAKEGVGEIGSLYGPSLIIIDSMGTA